MFQNDHMLTTQIKTDAPGLWKVEVIADNSGKWCSNGIVHPTRKRAEEAAENLACRWLAVREWRVVEAS